MVLIRKMSRRGTSNEYHVFMAKLKKNISPFRLQKSVVFQAILSYSFTFINLKFKMTYRQTGISLFHNLPIKIKSEKNKILKIEFSDY